MQLHITPAAQAQLEILLTTHMPQHVRVSLNNKGCSGHSYDWQLITTDEIKKFDHVVDLHAGKLVIKADSVLKLWGSTLDHVSNNMESQFVWHNPNVTVTCGCGHSVGFEPTCK